MAGKGRGSTGRAGRAPRTPKPRPRPTAVEVEPVPDVLGTEGLVNVLVEMLTGIQQQLARVRLAQVANAAGDDDPVAGYPPTRDDGTVNSYRMVRTELDEQEDRLAKKFPKEIDRVRELVAERAKREAAAA